LIEVYSVGDLTRHVKELLESDSTLQQLWVQGEVSNCVLSAAGHYYFTLKDAKSQIRCVLFRQQVRYQSYRPENGEAALVNGRVSIYEPQGAYQLYVNLVQPAGIGILYLQFAELRARLDREGLFDEARKRPIPRFPRRIGVVTSPTGAVIHDIINVVGRRYPLAEIVVAPTLVQGEGAPESICRALRAIDESGLVDVVIVARGGGSIEDLWPFNEEQVARTIFALRTPVISGVGHDTDFTIADFVADLRAPTPSAAAELAVPDFRECAAEVEGWRSRLVQGVFDELAERRRGAEALGRSLAVLSPARRVERFRQLVDDLASTSTRIVGHRLALVRERLAGTERQLQALSPLEVLDRGFGLVSDAATGELIRRTGQARSGRRIRVQVADGEFGGRVE
jgi:exodeoxyribonuclease VII large subunit